MSPTHRPDGHHPDLLGMLRGELGNAEQVAAGEHVRGCEDCRDDLVDAAVGHGLLTRMVDAVGTEVPTPERPAPAVAPGRGGLGQLGLSGLAGTGGVPRRPRLRLLAAAATLVVAAGTGAALTAGLGADESSGSGTTTTSVPQAGGATAVTAQLTPLGPAVDAGGVGVVTMDRDGADRTRMTFAVTDLPATVGGDHYYAWLLDPATQKMLPLGQVGSGESASFDVDDAVISAYSAIDVSLEADDGDPGHSVTSVLRGDYDPTTVVS